MAFLRRTKFRNLDEVATAMSKLDERISKAEGAGGFFETNRDIDVAGNKIKNLRIPIKYNDAARYSDAMRYCRYSMYVGANTSIAVGGRQMQPGNYHNNVGYTRSNGTLAYTTPVALQFKQVFFTAGQKGSTSNQQIRFFLSKDATGFDPSTLVASATIHSRIPGQYTYRASLILNPYKSIIPAGNTLVMVIYVPSYSTRWSLAGAIADFLVIDQ